MLKFFEQFAELLSAALEYLELDEGYEPHEIDNVEVEISSIGRCILSFPEINVTYFASNWSNGISNAEWLFTR
jgi:hypothetical protein